MTNHVLSRDESFFAVPELKNSIKSKLSDSNKPVNQDYFLTLLQTVPGGVSIAVDTLGEKLIHNLQNAAFLRIPSKIATSPSPFPPTILIYRNNTLLTPDDLPLVRAARYKQEITNEELDFIWADGSQKTALWNAKPIYAANGECLGALAVCVDITDRKQIEKDIWDYRKYLERIIHERTLKLQETRTGLKDLNTTLIDILESITDGFFALDYRGYFTYVNEEATRLLGKTKLDLLETDFLQEFPADQRLIDSYHSAMTSHQPSHFEFYSSTTRRWLEVHLYPSSFSHGVSAFLRDITERIETKTAREAERQRLYALLDSLPGIVSVHRPDYTLAYANKNYRRVFGDPGNGTCYESVLGNSTPCDNCPTMLTLQSGVSRHWEHVIHDSIYAMYENLFMDIDGSPLVVKVGFDITVKKQTEQEIARLDRLNLLAEMSAGIAHEIRNPLTTVRGFLQVLSSKQKDHEHYYNLMIEELDRANAIITEFLSLARNKVSEMRATSLNQIIVSLFPLIMADALMQNKQVITDLNEVETLSMNEMEVRQLILNLARNGLESMNSEGTLTIRTYMQGHRVVLAVEDQGSGISPEHLKKLGTPFFTTKERGTGLGLTICYGIAARHNATIEAVPTLQGTTFYVRFCPDNSLAKR